MRDEAYTLQQLATEAGVSVHAVRKYRYLRLIDPPSGPKCSPIYTNLHLRQLLYVVRRKEDNVRLEDLIGATSGTYQ
jgi:DNA-binding transcriptional MerR regulator